jgi:hypothetical protein
MATETGFGVALKDVTDVRLAENRIERNRVGLQVDGAVHRDPNEALVVRNRFAANEVGVALMATADMAFAANEFDGNLSQVLASDAGGARPNDWTNGGTGNTWSDYYGFDLDKDGIGDIPYLSAGLGPVITTTAPALAAYRTSPAMVLLETAQRLWASDRGAVVRDHAPRLLPVADLDEVVSGGAVASTLTTVPDPAARSGGQPSPVGGTASAGANGALDAAANHDATALLAWLALGLGLLVTPPLALAWITRSVAARATSPTSRSTPA